VKYILNKEQFKIGIVIPARFDSSRLPGKPLIDLCGKSMIKRTWERCVKVLPSERVYIATDSDVIKAHCSDFTTQVIMTSKDCLTGTDRVAEANETLALDMVINVQGDEPIIEPDEILAVINYALENQGSIVNAFAVIDDESEFRSLTIPKVVMTPQKNLLYMSRAAIPSSKSAIFDFAFKQICIYAFPKEALKIFKSYGKKTPLESIEDIEILRFIELGLPVKMVEVSGRSMAIDVDNDVVKVRKIISNIDVHKKQ